MLRRDRWFDQHPILACCLLLPIVGVASALCAVIDGWEYLREVVDIFLSRR